MKPGEWGEDESKIWSKEFDMKTIFLYKDTKP